MSDRREDPAVWTARREALVVLLIFLGALIYTVTFCYLRGYDRPPETLTFILGFPDWVFWGIVVPWGVCVVLSYWFGHTFMRDSNLGYDSDPEAGDGMEEDYD